MRRFRSGPLLLLCLICSVSASAQQSTSTSAAPTSDPQAVALVHRSLAELTGGVAVTDVTLTGTAHRIAGSDDETGTATLEATSAGDSRVDLLFPSGNRTEIPIRQAPPSRTVSLRTFSCPPWRCKARNRSARGPVQTVLLTAWLAIT